VTHPTENSTCRRVLPTPTGTLTPGLVSAGAEAAAYCSTVRGRQRLLRHVRGGPLFFWGTEHRAARTRSFVFGSLFFVLQVGWAVGVPVASRPCGAGLAGFPVPPNPSLVARDRLSVIGSGRRPRATNDGTITKERTVSHHTIDELINLWRHEKLTAEQAIGQILQVLRDQERRLREAMRRPPATGDSPDATISDHPR
jgi:hypothetical protein